MQVCVFLTYDSFYYNYSVVSNRFLFFTFSFSGSSTLLSMHSVSPLSNTRKLLLVFSGSFNQQLPIPKIKILCTNLKLA